MSRELSRMVEYARDCETLDEVDDERDWDSPSRSSAVLC